jgi:hypothetical protein
MLAFARALRARAGFAEMKSSSKEIFALDFSSEFFSAQVCWESGR